MTGPHRFRKAFDAICHAGKIDSLGNAVCISHHNITSLQRNPCFPNETGDVFL